MAASEVMCKNILDEERSSQKSGIAMNKWRRLKLSSLASSIGANKTRPWEGLFLAIANLKIRIVFNRLFYELLQNMVLDISLYLYTFIYSKYQWLLGNINQVCVSMFVMKLHLVL